MPFQTTLTKLPELLQIQVSNHLAQFQDKLKTLQLEFNPSPDLASDLIKVWASSLFVSENCVREPQLLLELINSNDLFIAYSQTTYSEKLKQYTINDETHLMKLLRHYRRREMLRIAWRDIAGLADLNETLLELSWLADSCIQYALDYLYQVACEKRGTPLLSNGQPQQIIVLGMGKLGAFELNYSSDIDLIFAYVENGVLPDRKNTSYGEFFTKLCQSLVRVLDDITVDGFVFRTDIRLRPYGDSGAVIMTFDGMEHYYLTQAREWERYAMIKARQVAGDFTSGAQLMKMLQAFVYRRYLDYGAFAELRSLKAQISQELRRKDRADNVKLGLGGIREIEFIGQAFQLIRGGSEKRLQIRPIMQVLSLLGELKLIAQQDAEQLKTAYCFLRRVENHIQQYQDKQTHDVPTLTTAQQSLLYSLDYNDWDSFIADLNKVRNQVHNLFDEVFSVSKQHSISEQGQLLWSGNLADNELIELFQELGFQQIEDNITALRYFKQSPAIRRLSNKGSATLDYLMPQVLEALKTINNRDETLKRVLNLFEAVAGRSVYLALLAENPQALAQLLKLTSASAWIAQYLAQYPLLFDELLDARTLYEPLNKTDLDSQLNKLCADIDSQDLERLMIVLREFKRANVLKVACADIMGVIPLMVVSDYLTYIAESILNCVLIRAWQMLVDKHGSPVNSNSIEGFAILGFGKLGGIELGYGSDLDMVFLYNHPNGNAMTLGGEKPISCSQFYGRLGQKIRHILDTKLLSGVLYEVDMRLRPSGDSGLLVTHINSYEPYLKNQAWTWEHQALVRGRFITGDMNLKSEYEAIRARILALPRDNEALKIEVREMRQKMRDAHAQDNANNEKNHLFDLKHGIGGIADIEFMVQFGILAQSVNNEQLTRYTDNVRLIEALKTQGFFSEHQAKQLTSAYCAYRDYGHKRVLQGNKAVIDDEQVFEMREQIKIIWHAIME
ncbi:MAG: bifunctional [glutamate--ammonia ligase]-adenylyl-L-tyrosine phosphorylase/[glutamate--ammonia-ligase] adenylyltransferase [Methylococcaceae bacterium]